MRETHGEPMENAMRKATLIVERDAKRYAPVDTGRLRSSITPQVVTQSKTVKGIVGSNVVYAPFVEDGTRPHWPPVSALAVWARRHHMSAYVVARSIAARGTKGVHMLKRALDDNMDKIEALIDGVVAKIVRPQG